MVLVVLVVLVVVTGAALAVVAARAMRVLEARGAGSTRAGALSLAIAEGDAGSLALVVLLSATIAVFAVAFIGAAALAFGRTPRVLTIAMTAAVAIAIEIAPTDSTVRRALGCARGEDVAIGVIAKGDVASGDANAPPPLKPMMSSACDVEEDDDAEASALHNARMSMSAEDSVVAGAGGVALDERPPPRLPNVASENSTLVSFRSPTR